MATDSVAFTTDEEPSLKTGTDVDAPSDCYVYKWVVSFFITRESGLSPAVSLVSGFVVQRVDVSKRVFKCDGSIDEENSKKETVLETFTVKDGESNGTDTIQFSFPKQRRTSLAVTFSACFLREIVGATRTEINPLTNVGGADGTLDKRPDGFVPTLTRRIHIVVDCCSDVEKFWWGTSANNLSFTYEEEWGNATGQERSERKKIVDGKPIEVGGG